MSENLLKIVKYIDYCYINNYIKNCLKITNNLQNVNDWKIFTNYSNDEKYNILYLLQMIYLKNKLNSDTFLLSIHIYKKICIKYAHVIDNYVSLFGSVYVAINKIYCDKYLTDYFLVECLRIELKIIKKMISCVEKFLMFDEIYFGFDEKKKIKNEISWI